ncbi:AAA family ATPase [Candidatus Dependentiae bacterium]|nr:AAA family ATPase [Candidatus Dependentiae bacterium]
MVKEQNSNIKNKNSQKNNLKFRPKRVFVLDTNVLLHDSDSLYSFKGVVVAIPFVVLEELDSFKKDQGEIGRNARLIIRNIDELRIKGCLSNGVEIGNGTKSILKIIETPKIGDDEIFGDLVDNLIIRTAQNLVKEGNEVTFVTKDINSRVKADALGLDAEDYTKQKITTEDFYKGWLKVKIPANDLRKVTKNNILELLKNKNIFIDFLTPNQFIILESENNPENNKLFRFTGGKNFKEVADSKITGHLGAKNIQQLMAIDLLRDDSIKIITLVGPAGTGKTFLTLLMGLHKVIKEHLYRKFLISRPVIALGADIGYLPGEVQEKLRYWMQPVYDNLEFIYSQIDEYDDQHTGFLGKKDKKDSKKKHKGKKGTENPVEMLQQKGVLSLEAITYMRGRSIPYQFVLIDEVQNLNPHEVKTIVSRAGEGTKMILAGDPFQIDSPYLDFTSNGLTVSTAKFKGQSIFGTVFLEKSERSELATLAAKIL